MRELYKKVMFEQITKKAECLYNLIGKKPGFDIFKAVTNLGGCYIQDKNNQLPSGIDAKINVVLILHNFLTWIKLILCKFVIYLK